MGVVAECQACRRRGDSSQEALGDSHQHTQHKHSTQTKEVGQTCVHDRRVYMTDRHVSKTYVQ